MSYERKALVARWAMTMAMAIAAVPANAQAPVAMSESFRASAEIARQRLDASDFVGAGADARALLASAQNPLETYTAAAMLMQASARVMDLQGEKLAIDGLRRSGLVPPERLIALDGVLGLAHLGLGENRDAAAVLARAHAAGVRDPKVALGLAEARSRIGDLAGSLAATRDALGLMALGGNAIPQSWYERGIALAVQHGDVAAQAEWTRRMLAQAGSPAAWRSGLMAFLPRLASDAEATLDLYRLMAATGALTTERDWSAYAASAERAAALSESVMALQTGQARGAIASADPLFARQIAALRIRSAKAQAGQAARAAAALKAPTGTAAMRMGDEWLAAGQATKAVEQYRAALAKGGIPVERVQLRLGIAQVRAGDVAAAQTTWSQIQAGPLAPLAGFWLAWAANAARGAGSPTL